MTDTSRRNTVYELRSDQQEGRKTANHSNWKDSLDRPINDNKSRSPDVETSVEAPAAEVDSSSIMGIHVQHDLHVESISAHGRISK